MHRRKDKRTASTKRSLEERSQPEKSDAGAARGTEEGMEATGAARKHDERNEAAPLQTQKLANIGKHSAILVRSHSVSRRWRDLSAGAMRAQLW